MTERKAETDPMETAKSLFEEYTAAGREYATAATTAAIDGAKAAFAIQDQAIKASRDLYLKVTTSGAKLVEDVLSAK